MVVDSRRLEKTGVGDQGTGFCGGEAMGSRKEKLLRQETQENGWHLQQAEKEQEFQFKRWN